MLPKQHRLSKKADVNLTTAKGRSFFSQNFIIKFLSKSEIKLPLMTVIVSNKVSKSAVVRNRLKRIIRQYLQEIIINTKPGFYVIIVKKSAVLITADELRLEILTSLKKSKIYQNV